MESKLDRFKKGDAAYKIPFTLLKTLQICWMCILKVSLLSIKTPKYLKTSTNSNFSLLKYSYIG